MWLRFWTGSAVVMLFACARPTQGTRRERVADAPPVAPHEVLLSGVSSEIFEADRLRSLARAKELRIDRKSGRVSASQVELQRFHVDTKEPSGLLTAARASGHTSRPDLLLEGQVELTDPQGRRATSERAEYHEAEGALRMPSAVRVSGEDFEVTGAGAVYWVASEKLQVKPPIRAVVRER